MLVTTLVVESEGRVLVNKTRIGGLGGDFMMIDHERQSVFINTKHRKRSLALIIEVKKALGVK